MIKSLNNDLPFESTVFVIKHSNSAQPLCDCPPAMSFEQMMAMKSAALNYPTLITILFNTLRFLPTFVKMKKLIADGYIGQINVINCNVFGDSLQGISLFV